MAKRASKKKQGNEFPGGHTTAETITAFAEDLGQVLSNAKAKAEGWLGQRREIAKSLIGIRDASTHLLQQLGHEASLVIRRRGPGKRRKAALGGPKQKMSAKARKAISDAQKKRWAAVRASNKA